MSPLPRKQEETEEWLHSVANGQQKRLGMASMELSLVDDRRGAEFWRE
jgi:hypothetical protein